MVIQNPDPWSLSTILYNDLEVEDNEGPANPQIRQVWERGNPRWCVEGRTARETTQWESAWIEGLLNQVFGFNGNRSIPMSSSNYGCLLQFCIDARKFAEGRQVLAHMIQKGFSFDILIHILLLEMYAKSGEPVGAGEAF